MQKFQGIPVPTNKSVFRLSKIENLLNLIPDICKFNQETQFIISKATEMFILFYAEKAIEISSRLNSVHNNDDEDINSVEHTQLSISGQHCFDAIETDHRFNFLIPTSVESIVLRIKIKNDINLNISVPMSYLCISCGKSGAHWIINCPLLQLSAQK